MHVCIYVHSYHSQETLAQHSHFWCHEEHFKISLEIQGPSTFPVIYRSKVLENILGNPGRQVRLTGIRPYVPLFSLSDYPKPSTHECTGNCC